MRELVALTTEVEILALLHNIHDLLDVIALMATIATCLLIIRAFFGLFPKGK